MCCIHTSVNSIFVTWKTNFFTYTSKFTCIQVLLVIF